MHRSMRHGALCAVFLFANACSLGTLSAADLLTESQFQVKGGSVDKADGGLILTTNAKTGRWNQTSLAWTTLAQPVRGKLVVALNAKPLDHPYYGVIVGTPKTPNMVTALFSNKSYSCQIIQYNTAGKRVESGKKTGGARPAGPVELTVDTVNKTITVRTGGGFELTEPLKVDLDQIETVGVSGLNGASDPVRSTKFTDLSLTHDDTNVAPASVKAAGSSAKAAMASVSDGDLFANADFKTDSGSIEKTDDGLILTTDAKSGRWPTTSLAFTELAKPVRGKIVVALDAKPLDFPFYGVVVGTRQTPNMVAASFSNKSYTCQVFQHNAQGKRVESGKKTGGARPAGPVELTVDTVNKTITVRTGGGFELTEPLKVDLEQIETVGVSGLNSGAQPVRTARFSNLSIQHEGSAAAVKAGDAHDAPPTSPSPIADDSLTQQAIDVEQLLNWPDYGIGQVTGFRGEALVMTETQDSKGVMTVSPNAFGPRVILRYRAMAMNPASVLVTILSASDGKGDALTLPDGYDGAIGPWVGPKPGYFFAFHNAAHMRRPFVMRTRPEGNQTLSEADSHAMQVGRWHEIEVGRWDGRMWLRIDGRMVVDATDAQPLPGGHVALRIRGTDHQAAHVMIQNVRILTPKTSPAPAASAGHSDSDASANPDDYAGLIALAARQGPRPDSVQRDNDRVIYTDPTTGHQVWRISSFVGKTHHRYYDIPAWSANGRWMLLDSDRTGGEQQPWIVAADGTFLHPLQFPDVPSVEDRGMRAYGAMWNPNDPDACYFSYYDAVFWKGSASRVIRADAQSGEVDVLKVIPQKGLRLQDISPDGRYLLLCHGGTMYWNARPHPPTDVVIYDLKTNEYTQTQVPATHRQRFTQRPDNSIFLRGGGENQLWSFDLTTKLATLPNFGHPAFSNNGELVANGGAQLVVRIKDAYAFDVFHPLADADIYKGSHGDFSHDGRFYVGDGYPKRMGHYDNFVWVTDLADLENPGAIQLLAAANSQPGGNQGGHPHPHSSPDDTKVIFGSTMFQAIGEKGISEFADAYVVVWKRPHAPRNVRHKGDTISWSAPERAKEIAHYVVYGQRDARWSVLATVAADQTSATVAGAFDRIAVAAREWSGLESEPIDTHGERFVMTRAMPAPAKVTAAERGRDSVTLSWTAPEADAISHYNVYASTASEFELSNATLVGSPKTPGFVDAVLQPATEYTYRITACDHQGNESADSAAIALTTAQR